MLTWGLWTSLDSVNDKTIFEFARAYLELVYSLNETWPYTSTKGSPLTHQTLNMSNHARTPPASHELATNARYEQPSWGSWCWTLETALGFRLSMLDFFFLRPSEGWSPLNLWQKWMWPVRDLRSGRNACADWTLQLILKRCGNFWAEHEKEAEGAVQGKIDELTFYFKRSHAAVKPKYIPHTTKWPTREWWENEDDKRQGHSIHWLTWNKI